MHLQSLAIRRNDDITMWVDPQHQTPPRPSLHNIHSKTDLLAPLPPRWRPRRFSIFFSHKWMVNRVWEFCFVDFWFSRVNLFRLCRWDCACWCFALYHPRSLQLCWFYLLELNFGDWVDLILSFKVNPSTFHNVDTVNNNNDSNKHRTVRRST